MSQHQRTNQLKPTERQSLNKLFGHSFGHFRPLATEVDFALSSFIMQERGRMNNEKTYRLDQLIIERHATAPDGR